ncbi:LysR family transcriptional regulator [Paraburkholderia sediminicola]|uniref:LysR family transcriptional regulator n=2 Tax=Paraburkholderia sediminicola TaxID=458836 RepID=UPI0038BC601E
MSNQVRNLRSVNMNLLPILGELLRCPNVSHAANRLHLTQSTVSGSLKQLRLLFEDDLLVQRGREMVLTEKAKELRPEVERLLEQASRLFCAETFDPATAANCFRIATADYVSALVTSRLGPVLQANAPGVSITLTPTPGTTAKDLRLGVVDLIICPNRRENWEACGIAAHDPEFCHELFIRDRLVAIQSANRSLAERPLALADYLARPHAMYCRTDGQPTIEQETLAQMGLVQRIQFLVPYFTLLPQLVVDSHLVALIPLSLANHYARLFPLDVFEPPVPFPSLDLVMIGACHRADRADLYWLRKIVRDSASSFLDIGNEGGCLETASACAPTDVEVTTAAGTPLLPPRALVRPGHGENRYRVSEESVSPSSSALISFPQ